MTQQHDIEKFEELSAKHSTWIIKYCSTSFDVPFYLVWYTDTDEDSTDRLLTYKDGEIFAIKSLTELKTMLLSEINKLVVFNNLNPWLEDIKDVEPIQYCTYDLISVTNNIDKKNLDIATIENFRNFINLYGDYIHQDDRNSHLQVYADNELIRETWEYSYNCIFWPRLSDEVKFETWARPPLIIDTNKLLENLNIIIKTFDNNIKLKK